MSSRIHSKSYRKILIIISTVLLGLAVLSVLAYLLAPRIPALQSLLAPIFEQDKALSPRATREHPCMPRQSCLVEIPGRLPFAPRQRYLMSVWVFERGIEALHTVGLWDESNPEPPLGTEYILVGVSIAYLGGPDKIAVIQEQQFSVVSKDGRVYDIPKTKGNWQPCNIKAMRNGGGKCLLPAFRTPGQVNYLVFQLDSGGGAWFYLD